MLRHPIGEIGRHQRQGDLDPRIACPVTQPQRQPADADSPDDLADHDERERAGRLAERERAGGNRGNCEAVKDQCGGIVGEAFAFEHDDQSPRHTEPPRDGEGRHHVRRRDDRAKQERHAPLPAEQIMQCDGDRAGGEHHAAECQQCDGPEVEAELAPAHRDAGRVDQRRQDDEQHDLRCQLDAWQARDERQRNARDHQEDRRRDLEPLRQHRDRDADREQQ